MMDAQPTPAAATPAAVVPDTLVLVDAAYIDQAKKVTSSWVNEYGMIIGVE